MASLKRKSQQDGRDTVWAEFWWTIPKTCVEFNTAVEGFWRRRNHKLKYDTNIWVVCQRVSVGEGEFGGARGCALEEQESTAWHEKPLGYIHCGGHPSGLGRKSMSKGLLEKTKSSTDGEGVFILGWVL